MFLLKPYFYAHTFAGLKASIIVVQGSPTLLLVSYCPNNFSSNQTQLKHQINVLRVGFNYKQVC